MYLNPKYIKIKYGNMKKMPFSGAHTPRRNMVKPMIAAMRESVKYIYRAFFSSTPTQSARRRIGCSSDTAAACTRECFLINDHPGRPTLVCAIQSLQSSSKHSRNPSSATLSPALKPHAASSRLRPSHLRSSIGLTQHAPPSGQTHVRACPGAWSSCAKLPLPPSRSLQRQP